MMDQKLQEHFPDLFPHFMRNLAHAIYGLDYPEESLSSDEENHTLASENFLTQLEHHYLASHKRQEFDELHLLGLQMLVHTLRRYIFEIDAHRLKNNRGEGSMDSS